MFGAFTASTGPPSPFSISGIGSPPFMPARFSTVTVRSLPATPRTSWRSARASRRLATSGSIAHFAGQPPEDQPLHQIARQRLVDVFGNPEFLHQHAVEDDVLALADHEHHHIGRADAREVLQRALRIVQTTAARQAYPDAIAVQPANAQAQLGLGRTLVRADPRAAEAAFLAAAAAAPDDPTILNNLGIARDMQGHHAEAQQAYRQALLAAPGLADVQTNLGLSLALSGDKQESTRVLQALARDPRTTGAVRDPPAAALAVADRAPGPPVSEYPAPFAVATAPVIAVQRQDLATPAAPRLPTPAAAPPVRLAQPAAPRPIPVRTPPAPARTLAETHAHQVQLAAVTSEPGAHAEALRLRRRLPDMLATQPFAITHLDGPGRSLWRIRATGFAKLDDARGFCARLQTLGGHCWVI